MTAQRLQHENDTLRRQLGDLCAKWVLQRVLEGGGSKSSCNMSAATGVASHCVIWILQRGLEGKGCESGAKWVLQGGHRAEAQVIAQSGCSSVIQGKGRK